MKSQRVNTLKLDSWLLTEMFVGVILCSFPSVWNLGLTEATLTRGLIVAGIFLFPSEFLRQYVGRQRLQSFFEALVQPEIDHLWAQYFRKIFTTRYVAFSVFGLACSLSLIMSSFYVHGIMSHIFEIFGTMSLTIVIGLLFLELSLTKRDKTLLNINEEVAKKELRDIIKGAMTWTTEFSELNLIGSARNRAEVPFADMISSARKEIKILGTELSYWYEMPGGKSSFKEALDSGCRVQMLYLNPNSQYAEVRGNEVRDGDKKYLIELRNTFRHIQNLDPRIEVMAYDSSPKNTIIIIDDHVIVSFLLSVLRGRDTYHIGFRKNLNRRQKSQFEREFEALWQQSQSLNGI